MASTLYLKLSAHGNPDFNQPHSIGVPTEWVKVDDWKDASRVVRIFIDKLGLGHGNWTGGEIRSGSRTGKVVANVSYNGRVWAGNRSNWKPDTKPLYG